jgi:hypothetical protein
MPTATDPQLRDQLAALTGQIARCDSKASLLLALTGTSLAGTLSVAASTRPGPAVLAVGGVGAALLLAATLLLLAVVRPNLGGPGWPRWPEMNDQQLRETLTGGQGLDEARTLAALARRKYERVRTAVDCARAGITLLATAAGLAVTA